MSIVSGLQSGLQSGLRSGLNPGGVADPMAGVTRDATSSKYVPSTAGEWTTTRSAAGISSANPTALWLCQDASGNLADALGANVLTAFSGPIGYQQVIAGWARGAVTLADGGAAAFYNVTGIGNTTTKSCLFLAYVAITATPAATRDVLFMGTSTATRTAQVTTAPVYRVIGAGGQATGTGAANPSTTVRPVLLQVDRTNGAIRVATDQECIEPAYTAPAGGAGTLQIGDSGAASPACAYVYMAYFEGAPAELSKASIKSLLQTLGWTVPWS